MAFCQMVATDDLTEQPVEENLKVLQGLHRAVSGLHYDIVRRAPAPDGHITRIEEYLDSGKRAAIKAAREALSA
jgi:hypothetical protein